MKHFSHITSPTASFDLAPSTSAGYTRSMKVPKWVSELFTRSAPLVTPAATTPIDESCTLLRASYTSTTSDAETVILSADERGELERLLKADNHRSRTPRVAAIVGYLDLVCDDGSTVKFGIRDGGVMTPLHHHYRAWAVPSIVQSIQRKLPPRNR